MPDYQIQFTDEEVRQIWQAEVRPRRFRQDVTPVAPELLLVGGQPGSGKTAGLNLLVRDSPAGMVVINGDDLRQFHPEYDQLVASDPLLMPQVTAALSGHLVEYSLAYGFTRGYSLAVEGTWRDPQVTIRTASLAKQHGHKVRAVCLAVPEPLSRIATATRYYFDVGQGRPGRWTPPSVHDQVVAGLPQVAGLIWEAGVIDQLQVVDRAGTVLLDSESSPRPDFAVSLETCLRGQLSRPLTHVELVDYQSRVAKVRELHGRFTSHEPEACHLLASIETDLERVVNLNTRLPKWYQAAYPDPPKLSSVIGPLLTEVSETESLIPVKDLLER